MIKIYGIKSWAKWIGIYFCLVLPPTIYFARHNTYKTYNQTIMQYPVGYCQSSAKFILQPDDEYKCGLYSKIEIDTHFDRGYLVKCICPTKD